MEKYLTLNRGADFDDPEYGFKEEDKGLQKVTCSESKTGISDTDGGRPKTKLS